MFIISVDPYHVLRIDVSHVFHVSVSWLFKKQNMKYFILTVQKIFDLSVWHSCPLDNYNTVSNFHPIYCSIFIFQQYTTD